MKKKTEKAKTNSDQMSASNPFGQILEKSEVEVLRNSNEMLSNRLNRVNAEFDGYRMAVKDVMGA